MPCSLCRKRFDENNPEHKNSPLHNQYYCVECWNNNPHLQEIFLKDKQHREKERLRAVEEKRALRARAESEEQQAPPMRNCRTCHMVVVQGAVNKPGRYHTGEFVGTHGHYADYMHPDPTWLCCGVEDDDAGCAECLHDHLTQQEIESDCLLLSKELRIQHILNSYEK
eukprot:TRINITY_DN15675_c0_g1_i1.p1 TRINITY_DN15675_c0_g1~~TRINITY_DN15675_c0_g1_i1.p1  ORF type:complete len:168 (-),score=24.51 TRINITY_DN15675_c0_g1_i1:93-596(-)